MSRRWRYTIAPESPAVVAGRRSSASCRRGVRRTTARTAKKLPPERSREATKSGDLRVPRRSVECLEQCSLEIARLRNRQHFRMIERLRGDRAQRHATSGIRRGVLQHLEKDRLREMEAAARREEQ